MSSVQFQQPDFVEQALGILQETGANPHRLVMELTESLLVDNIEGVAQRMNALKARGLGFSLDDFGTGFSSLTYLKRLPLDKLKIDQSFVRDIELDPNDLAIAGTIVALGDSLGLRVLAEEMRPHGVRVVTIHQPGAAGGCSPRPLPGLSPVLAPGCCRGRG